MQVDMLCMISQSNHRYPVKVTQGCCSNKRVDL